MRSIGSVTSDDVRALQRREERRAEQHALAAEGVVRPDLATQLGVAQLPAHERRRARAPEQAERARVADHQRQRLAVLVDEAAPERLHARDVTDRPRHERRVGAVAARHEPVARPLEDGQVPHVARDLGHELDGARAGSDHCDALAAQVVVVVPLRRVEAVAGELVEALDPRVRGTVELTGREDQGLGLPLLARGAADRPRPRPRHPRRTRRSRRRSASGDRCRGRGPPPSGTRGCPPAASTAATSRAAGRTRTSTGGSARRTPRPGSCCGTTCRRARAPGRGS